MDALGTLAHVICGGLLLEECSLRDEDRQGIVQFVRDAREQRAHGGKLLDLMDAGALVVDLLLLPSGFPQVAEMRGEERGALQLHLVDRHLDRDELPVEARASSWSLLPMTRETPVAM